MQNNYAPLANFHTNTNIFKEKTTKTIAAAKNAVQCNIIN